MNHVETVRKANPNKSFKEVLKMAGKTYKKQAKAHGDKKAKKTRKVRKGSRKASRKGTRKGRKGRKGSKRHRGGMGTIQGTTPGAGTDTATPV